LEIYWTKNGIFTDIKPLSTHYTPSETLSFLIHSIALISARSDCLEPVLCPAWILVRIAVALLILPGTIDSTAGLIEPLCRNPNEP